MQKRPGRMLLVVIVVMAVGALVLWRMGHHGGPSSCDALGTDVAGFDGWQDDSGATAGPGWISALTEGTRRADPPSRERLAIAVDADGKGYVAFRAALPDDQVPAANRLHEIAIDPNYPEDDPKLARDAKAIAREVARCEFAP